MTRHDAKQEPAAPRFGGATRRAAGLAVACFLHFIYKCIPCASPAGSVIVSPSFPNISS